MPTLSRLTLPLLFAGLAATSQAAVQNVETIASPAGPLDCWVVTTDYNQPGAEARFWFAKASQLMVREQSSPHDGKVLVETLIE